MTETKNKQEYIRQWTDYIHTLHTLAFCSDEKLSNEVRNKIEDLKELVPKIAETKDLR